MTVRGTTDGDGFQLPARAAKDDPVAGLRADLARLGSSVGSLERACARLQLALIVVTMSLGLFLPFARTDAGGRDDLPTDHHVLGLFGQLFDPGLGFVGGSHHSVSASLGRTTMLIGIGLLLVGVLVAICGFAAVVDSTPRRASVRLLTWGGIGMTIGLLVAVVGALLLSRRTEITVISLGMLFMIIAAVLVLVTASDVRERAS